MVAVRTVSSHCCEMLAPYSCCTRCCGKSWKVHMPASLKAGAETMSMRSRANGLRRMMHPSLGVLFFEQQQRRTVGAAQQRAGGAARRRAQYHTALTQTRDARAHVGGPENHQRLGAHSRVVEGEVEVIAGQGQMRIRDLPLFRGDEPQRLPERLRLRKVCGRQAHFREVTAQ